MPSDIATTHAPIITYTSRIYNPTLFHLLYDRRISKDATIPYRYRKDQLWSCPTNDVLDDPIPLIHANANTPTKISDKIPADKDFVKIYTDTDNTNTCNQKRHCIILPPVTGFTPLCIPKMISCIRASVKINGANARSDPVPLYQTRIATINNIHHVHIDSLLLYTLVSVTMTVDTVSGSDILFRGIFIYGGNNTITTVL